MNLNAPEATRRTKFANWLTQSENPLLARVIVNRIWQHTFGRGIVATPNDFGNSGQKPSHPQLLDWLASELIDSGLVAQAHPTIGLVLAYLSAVGEPGLLMG